MIMELSACLLILPKKFHTAISSGSKLTMSVLALLPPLFANIANSRTKALKREVIPMFMICHGMIYSDFTYEVIYSRQIYILILLHLIRYDRLWFR